MTKAQATTVITSYVRNARHPQTIQNVYHEVEMLGFAGDDTDDILDAANIHADPEMIGSTIVQYAVIR